MLAEISSLLKQRLSGKKYVNYCSFHFLNAWQHILTINESLNPQTSEKTALMMLSALNHTTKSAFYTHESHLQQMTATFIEGLWQLLYFTDQKGLQTHEIKKESLSVTWTISLRVLCRKSSVIWLMMLKRIVSKKCSVHFSRQKVNDAGRRSL